MRTKDQIDTLPDESASPPTTAANSISLAPIVPLLLDEAQAALLLSLSPRKLWELAARGAVKFVKIGTLKRYRRIDLETWVASGCPIE